MRDYLRLIKYYGLTGMIAVLKIAFGKTNAIGLNAIKTTVYLRTGTSDIPTFYQVFGRKEYAFNILFKPNVIVDAGANIGLTAVYFANRFPDTKIFCIEPDQSNYEVLVKNTQSYKNITPIKAALWDVKSEVAIIDRGNGNWAFEIDENLSDNSVQINTITISELMALYHIDFIDLLKIDIEGSEKELFRSNYDQWLTKVRCLVIELHDRMKKGTSKSVFSAVSKYDFSYTHKGENHIFFFDQKA